MTAFAVTLLPFLAGLYALVVALDPYGTRVALGHAPTPIMDLNQRYMYPQLARSGLYDAAIFGTSTIRLLDPNRLDAAFGAHFVNLGINAGTPWEQMQLAELFLRHVPHPKMLILGLDRNWCEPDADAEGKRITFRSFPPWLYDENPFNDYPELLNLKSLEIAARIALDRLGLMPDRIRRDGYEVFTPPENRYDLQRARLHIWSGTPGHVEPVRPPLELTPQQAAALPLPALDWLADFVRQVPSDTRLLFVMPPIHVAGQAAPGSRLAAEDAACKARIAAIGRRHDATIVDFRMASSITTVDSNYWDQLHYRLPIARRIVDDLKRAEATGEDAPDGSYRVVSRTGS